MLIVYTAAIFTSALLLFFVQPMFARMVLPLLGGSPAVWNTALVFYQAVLLAGYLYAHATTKWLKPRRQVPLHFGLMLAVLLALPIGVPSGWVPPVETDPVLWLLGLFAVAVGLPFFVVSTSSPLLQRWFAWTGHRHAPDPYFLYSASNLGSMLALVIYPALAEPMLRLREQAGWWATGYAGLIGLTGLCAVFLMRSRGLRVGASFADAAVPAGASPSSGREWPLGIPPALSPSRLCVWRRARWVILALVPSSLMLSVTTYMTTDIAAVPMLWVIPLGIYLLSFILVFARRPPVPHRWMVKLMPIVLLPLVIAVTIRGTDPIAAVIPLHLIAFFVIAMVCHGELAHDRPPVDRLTEFYLCLSIGGVLGGAFNALIAPLVFKSVAEYPIVLAVSCLLLPWKSGVSWRSAARMLDLVLPALLAVATVLVVLKIQGRGIEPGPLPIALMFGLPAIVSFSFSRRPLRFALAVAGIFLAGNYYTGSQGRVLYAERSFFGVSRVTIDAAGRYHQYMHGSTLHGRQLLDQALRREPVAYYYKSGPLGQFFDALGGQDRLQRVAIIGLGAGGITAYAKPGQEWTYYEIDPLVERIARDPQYFTYLRDCPAGLKVILGDGRLKLAEAPDNAYDLLILDAYSSDSMPVHLLTREAVELYLRKLAPKGILLFHISNRYLDIEPLLGNFTRHLGLFGLAQSDTTVTPTEGKKGKTASSFALMCRSEGDVGSLACDHRWRALRTKDSLGIWTDDYSSILSILIWHR